ncbi:MAG TPA: hypothetical protein VKA15_17440 [Isosphaeraceae bacterium]|nr:hypothetical protein [Isosphaeraceae bacterium]
MGLAALTLVGFGVVLTYATSEAAVNIVFSAGVFWWLFALFSLAAVLQTIREAARAVIVAIQASPDATAAAMRRAVRPAATKEAS